MRTAFCFDLDGTITQEELLPAIAAQVGVAEEIETLTRATMDGVIPFGQSLRLRALILGLVPVSEVHAILHEVAIDDQISGFISARPAECFVVTGNLDVWLAPMRERLPCEFFSSQAIQNGDRLSVEQVLDKASAVDRVRRLGFDRVIAAGDGANDRPMFDAADISIAYAGVHSPPVSLTDASQYVVFEGGVLCSLLAEL